MCPEDRTPDQDEDEDEAVTGASRHGTAINPHRQRLSRENDHGRNVKNHKAREQDRKAGQEGER